MNFQRLYQHISQANDHKTVRVQRKEKQRKEHKGNPELGFNDFENGTEFSFMNSHGEILLLYENCMWVQQPGGKEEINKKRALTAVARIRNNWKAHGSLNGVSVPYTANGVCRTRLINR